MPAKENLFAASARMSLAKKHPLKDPLLQEEPWCATCHSRPETRLLCCSRCHTAWYCSKDCQIADYREHKEDCLDVSKHWKFVEEEAASLRMTRFAGNDENLFEMRVGFFGEIEEMHDYIEARLGLMTTYVEAAFRVEIKSVWEKALHHALALLRLNATGPPPSPILSAAIFIPLILQRDDDTCDMIRFFINIDTEREEDMHEYFRMHSESKEGDWIYPREKNCRFLNFFDECADLTSPDQQMPFLLALLLVKCGIVATYNAISRSIKVFESTSGGQRIHEVQMIVKEMLVDESLVNIKSQRKQVDRLVCGIHRNNCVVLRTLLEPDSLTGYILSQEERGLDVSLSSGTMSLLVYCMRCMIRIPGTHDVLEEDFMKAGFYDD
ncbi:hypothetical protein FisN_12Lu376 [Fistulifera solaris]|uniref:MYND-type domain-containing protein n=1 Tax=Fistulifera solaris TaxID=1519565 RepID=A0A1Z5JM67_FISSO|nr:hypothetical protein FisN_12Lu376 [Fistulifera solaris]|eukprot:GAX15113.1 hypothetical protein FisN_12Lu376 [Fistulifera solaris]